jgi:hypothetical protein
LWAVTPFKVKFVWQNKKLQTAVETNFVAYELTDGRTELTPDLKNWKNDVLTLYASWRGRNADLTLRNLIETNFKDAEYLNDLIVNETTETAKAKGMTDCACQTTGRIYTFPIPLPSALARESIAWGEPEVKTSEMTQGELWHARLGHLGDVSLKGTAEAYPQFGLPKKHVTDKGVQSNTCVCCSECKATRTHGKPSSKSPKATRYLERVHMDVCGPLQMSTYDGCKYFTVFIDEYTKFRWVYVHKDRTTSIEILKQWMFDATKGTHQKIECLRTDGAGEHMSKAYQDVLRKHKIRIECSAGYDHWQNGYAEKLIRDICNMARCMLEYGKVARDMWGYAVRYAAHVQNRIVHTNMVMSPYEMRYHEAPDLSRLKVFGCTAYVTRDKKDTDYILDPKLDPRGLEGCFVGISDDGAEVPGVAVKGFLVWTLETGARMVTSNQVSFNETRYLRLLGVTEWEFSLQAKVEKCKSTISVMTFDTEHIDRHPFVFENDELLYREQQLKTRLDPQPLVGLEVSIVYNDETRNGKIYNYLPKYKVWGIVLTEARDNDPVLVYVTTDHIADENKVIFKSVHEQMKAYKKHKKSKTETPDDISLMNLHLRDEIDMLRYDQATRNTHDICSRLLGLYQMKTKAPISRHEPEPKTWKQAMNSENYAKWYSAAEAEVLGLVDMDTWEVVRPKDGIKPIDSKWVFKVKYTPEGEIEKYKGRLVVRGDSQRAGLDYGEVFSPVAHNTICRMLLSMATACDFEINLVDVCQAFLNAELTEDIYMRQAPGVTQILGVPPDSWLRLKRNLYGLKQAPRNWSLTFIKWMLEEQKFHKASIDDCLFYKEFKHKGKDVFILLLMYVDDNIIISNDRECLDAFKADMHTKFKIVDKKDIKTYLGVQVERCREKGKRWLKIHQEGYLNEVLAAMNIKKNDPLTYNTPLPIGIQLIKNEGEMYELDVYRSVIGSLIYLATWTRPDISYAVSALAAHMVNPSRDHHVALKHLLHYLHGTRDTGITHHENDEHGINKLYGFADADYAGDCNTRKSRSGYIMMMNSGAISWKLKLQTVVANSTTDAEVYAATLAVKEIIYLRDALRRIGLPQATEDEPNKGTILYEDNEATAAIARTAAHREATKHMAIARAFLRIHHHESGSVHVTNCYTQYQVADFLTKPLGHQVFRKLVDEAIGKQEMKEIRRFARRNWQEEYDRDAQVSKLQRSEGVSNVLHDDAQGGMLKVELIDVVNLNRMKVVRCTRAKEDVDIRVNACVMCDTIDDYVKYEQHRLNVLNHVMAHDMKAEKREYNNIRVLSQRVDNIYQI